MKKGYRVDSVFQTTHHFCFSSASSASANAVHTGLREGHKTWDRRKTILPIQLALFFQAQGNKYLFNPLHVCKALHSGKLS